MNKLKTLISENWNVGAKLGLSFGVLILIVSCVGWFGLRQIGRDEAHLEKIIDVRWGKVELSREAQTYSNLNSRMTLQVFLGEEGRNIDSQIVAISANSERISSLIDTLRSKVTSADEGRLLDDIEAKRSPYVESYRRALRTLAVHKQPVEARVIMLEEAMPRLVEYHKAWDSYVAYQGHQMDLARDEEHTSYAVARLVSILLISLAIMFAAAIAVVVTSNTSRDVAQRKRAEAALQTAHNQLETKVRERTSELAAANEDLQREVTERKLVEAALRNSELRHRQIVDCASDTIYRISTNGHFTFINPSAAALVKRSVEECEGLHFLELVREDCRNQASDFYRQQIAEKIPVTYFEFPAVAKDESEVWIGQNVQLVIEGGKVVELQGIARDITTRKEIERQLLESEQRYRLLFEANPLPMWVYDVESLEFLAVNNAAVNHYGFSREEFLAMTIKDIRPQEDVPTLLESLSNVTDGLKEAGTWRHLKKDGTIIDVETTPHTLDFAGRPARIVLAVDITERKRAEEALSREQYLMRALMGNIPDAIFFKDPQGRFLRVNKALATKHKHASTEEAVGKTDFDFFLKESAQTRYDQEQEIIRSGQPLVDVEEEELWPDRLPTWTSTTKMPLRDEQDQIVGTFGVSRDITERKRAEKERSRLVAILESTPDFVATADVDGHVLYINRAGRKMLGIGEEEDITGMRISDAHPQWALEVVQSELFPTILKEGIWSGETAFLSRDGREIPISQVALAHRTPEGETEFLSTVARDITERKHAESEILLQKARFQQLFENAPMGILRVDQNDIVLDANKEFEAIFQFSLSEMRGRPINEIVLSKAQREEGTALSARALQGEIIDQETVRQRKDGTLIPVHIYGVPIVVNQKLVGVFAIYVDLSERKRLEEERQAVFEIIQGAIFTSDLGDLFKLIHKSISSLLYAENCFLALHDPATDLMHYEFWIDKFDPCPEPRLVGKGFGSYILRTGQPMLLDRELTEEFVRRGEVEKSGTASASWLGVPLRTLSRTIGVLVVQHYEDEHIYSQSDLEFLTSVGSQIALAIERKQAEQALQEANKRALTEYERLIERIASLGQTLGSARDLTIIFRALRDFAAASVPCDGLLVSLYEREKQARRVIYCWTDNEELNLKNVIEVPVGEGITGKAIRSGNVIIDNNFKPLVGAKGKPVLLGERADDSIPRSALIAPMTVMGRTVGCVEVQSHQIGAYVQEHATAMRMAANLTANAVENVTLIEREQAQEEQLRQAQKMESIGTLAGGIAHDFNNLMTAVTGYSDLALRSLTGDNSLRSKIEEIKKAGERAAALTRQLLAFSRKQMLQPKVLDLNTVVTGMAQMLPRLIGEHIDLRFRLGDSLGQVKADPGQIEQVVMNLAVNARDAMPEGGVLTIKTENVQLTGKFGHRDLSVEPGQYVMMDVSDTGSGMDTETQSHIFEPFFTTKEVGKGTGLGLSTVYGIVKQSGGSLWVYSEVGKGTNFKICLPRVDVLVESAEIVCKTEDAPRGQETVLLVEDEDVVRNLSKEILETYGYSVLVASNGREGLRVGSEFRGAIDLVITDVIMPQMSGREMAEGLRTIRPDTRVLFMSGFTDDAIVNHGAVDEKVFFIQKPFSPEALATKAREVLDQMASA